MQTKITIYGALTTEESDPYESTGNLTLRSPRNVPNFTETINLTLPGEIKKLTAG